MGTDINFLYYLDILYDERLNKEKGYNGIARGSSGLLLCSVQRYVETREIEDKNEVYTLIDRLTCQPINYCSFGYGLAGFAWIINSIKKVDLYKNVNEWLEEYDTILEKYYQLMLYKKDLDYFRGASGILFYFLERGFLHKNIIKPYVDCLHERENGILPSYYIGRDKNNINLGTPHGITGVILILLKIKEQGVYPVDSLIMDLLDELLSFQRIECSYHFPGTVSGENESESGLAWCYGDLMVSYAILKAGLLLHKKKYVDLVYPIMAELAHRKDCSDKLVLCHGYTSTSLVLRKMYDLTKDKALYNASIKWQKRAINTFHRRFEMYQKEQSNANYFGNTSLFYGFPGVLLSFGGIFRRDCEKSLLL